LKSGFMLLSRVAHRLAFSLFLLLLLSIVHFRLLAAVLHHIAESARKTNLISIMWQCSICGDRPKIVETPS
jgi:hypothetical protein